jgi:hypothetical protein
MTRRAGVLAHGVDRLLELRIVDKAADTAMALTTWVGTDVAPEARVHERHSQTGLPRGCVWPIMEKVESSSSRKSAAPGHTPRLAAPRGPRRPSDGG